MKTVLIFGGRNPTSILLFGFQISFQFQLGLSRDRVTVDNSSELTLKTLKSLACDFITEKFPSHGVTRLSERLLIYKHDYNSSNILQVRPGAEAHFTFYDLMLS